MKAALTTIIILSALNFYGQGIVIDSGMRNTVTPGNLTLQGTGIKIYHPGELEYTKPFDTIPCILMVSDDAVKGAKPFIISAFTVNKYTLGGWRNDYYFPAHWEHYIYLDENKKQLSFRVWMVQ